MVTIATTNAVKDPVVNWFPANIDACAFYRMFSPHLNVPRSIFTLRYGAMDINEILNQGVEVVVVQRLHSDDNLKCLKKFKQTGLKVVYDLDDDIWSLTASNPHKHLFDQKQDDFYKCAREADILTVSTQGLASAVKMGFNLNKEIQVVSNAVDFDLFQPMNVVENNDFIVIGWGGSNTHGADVKDAFSVLPEVLDEHPNIRMEIVGAPAQDKIREKMTNVEGKPILREIYKSSPIAMHKQTIFRPWIPIAEYANRLASWNWDLFLAPLEDTRFNRSKSCIKMLEAAALKKPCLASDVQPYREFCSLGGDDLLWLLCNSPKEWKEKLTVMVNEPERRKELGEKMYTVAKQYFDQAKVAEVWKYVFRKAVGRA